MIDISKYSHNFMKKEILQHFNYIGYFLKIKI